MAVYDERDVRHLLDNPAYAEVNGVVYRTMMLNEWPQCMPPAKVYAKVIVRAKAKKHLRADFNMRADLTGTNEAKYETLLVKLGEGGYTVTHLAADFLAANMPEVAIQLTRAFGLI